MIENDLLAELNFDNIPNIKNIVTGKGSGPRRQAFHCSVNDGFYAFRIYTTNCIICIQLFENKSDVPEYGLCWFQQLCQNVC